MAHALERPCVTESMPELSVSNSSEESPLQAHGPDAPEASAAQASTPCSGVTRRGAAARPANPIAESAPAKPNALACRPHLQGVGGGDSATREEEPPLQADALMRGRKRGVRTDSWNVAPLLTIFLLSLAPSASLAMSPPPLSSSEAISTLVDRGGHDARRTWKFAEGPTYSSPKVLFPEHNIFTRSEISF